MNKYIIVYILLLMFFFSNGYSQNYRIILDEKYEDWQNSSGISDSGDVTSGLDLIRLKADNYDNFLFLLLKLNTEINLQNDNNIILYIDTDNNPTTGFAINGIGAELEYYFGTRKGIFHYNNTENYIKHKDIGIVTLPTVTSTIFEMELDLNSAINGIKIFQDSLLHIVVKNDIPDGDIIPDNTNGFEYKLSQTSPQINVSYSINKTNKNHLRIISYNIERDRLFLDANKEAHKRIFKATQPDIIGFQEIYKHTAEETANLIEEFLPSSGEEKWYYSSTESDIKVVSRFPIKQSFAIDGNSAFLIDMTNKYNCSLLFIDAHPPCCNNNDARQKEIDHFISFIREAKKDGGNLTLDKNTPIVIVGDMNLVGFKEQQTTLITGNIINNDLYGEPFLPDWDNTFLQDSKPLTTNMPATFTWYDEGSSYNPGRLDYVVFTNSVMKTVNNYVLFTRALPQDTLTQYNLQSNDVTAVADHLPVIVDFELLPTVSVKTETQNGVKKFSLMQNYPNPFNPITIIRYSIPETTNSAVVNVTLKVFDTLGREIVTLVNKTEKAGNHSVKFNGAKFPSGIYYYRLTTAGYSETKKMVLLK